MASFKSWISALRPRTLFLAIATALCGSSIAYSVDMFSATDKFSGIVCILTLAIATILQLLSNMANDLGDYQHGTDITGERVGPQRTVQSGAITPKQMKRGIMIAISLATIVGLLLIYIALQFMSIKYMLVFLILGAASIVAAIKYTAGKNPYGYKGMGDIFSFVFFGLVSVVGTYFLHTHTIDCRPWLPAIGLGLLTVAVLNLNNMRDIENDKKSGKITIPVRIGIKNAKIYHSALTIGALVCFTIYSFIYACHWYQYLYLLCFLIFIKLLINIFRITENRLLDPYLKYTSMGTFILSVCFSICINL
ncbi:1,4-dihydroxy-2-naphthoate octaprenyltransferase [Dysgonomonas sp. Marseille-P4677]|uniref:1,4-dihydroxy-2-naphthoate octaprenyltransferase n=1 Tax=Dysgonomonas sp. Marseille-P4677 TaxID=2364790 RepID=UPI001913DC19|nr:1,4-dihydroxy-2-naphthoate octaprenyltransferase [Dysgonomonas sp. Marseille-P4677]MBK5721527.1 1,4-dihydroxy-2-naphthoate octaprenyltransferase [Dysgonomonas sp. Marseille-P4677]